MVYDGHMATDTASQTIMGMPFTITPAAATVCRMVTITDTARPFSGGHFFLHFERSPDAPMWKLTTASFRPTDGENIPLTKNNGPRPWNYANEPNAADAEVLPHALAMYPWLPAMVEHARPAF